MWSDNETIEDLLGFKVHADLIKEVITGSNILPLSIGVFGDWGSGKTSIMKILEQNLNASDDNKTITLYFNGWVFEGYDDAKAALIESILKQLIKSQKISTKGKKTFKKLSKSVDWLRAGKTALKGGQMLLSAYATGGFSLLNDFEKVKKFIGDIVDDPNKLIEKIKSEEGKELFDGLKKSIKKGEGSKNPVNKAIREFRTNFKKGLDESNIDCLIVLIDDLDRCSPERLIENLEAIKLFLNVEDTKTAFVIGADPRIVKHAIQYRYRAKDLLDSSLPEHENLVNDYLEKLIQIPYSLPRLSDNETETYISLLICKKELSQEDFAMVHDGFTEFRKKDKYSIFGFARIKEILKDGKQGVFDELSIVPKLSPLISSTLKGNPRQIKRFLNTLNLRQKLAKVADLDFKDDVLMKLMILEYLDVDSNKFIKLYELQAQADGYPEIIKEIEKALADLECDINDIWSQYPDWNSEKLKRWFKAEPYLSEVDLKDYFWLSRDKTASTLPGVSLVPPIVTKQFKSLLNAIDLSESKLEKEIKNITQTLDNDEYVEILLTLLKKNLIKSPQKREAHIVFFFFIKIHTKGLPQYVEGLSNIQLLDIPAGIGNDIYLLEQGGLNVSSIVEKLEKQPESKVYKAYNLKKQ